MNGQALDLFGPGRYTLETENIPILGRLLQLAVGQSLPFHCEVYFINKVQQMSVKWGTDSRVEYMEPVYGFPVSIGASGEMTLRVENGPVVLSKLVGTERDLSRQRLTEYFRAVLMTKVKTYIAQMMKAENISIFEVDEKLMEFSEALHTMLIPDFSDYGISLDRFYVTSIVKPDGERQYERFKELHFRQYADVAEAKLRQQTDLIYAQTEAQKMMLDSKAQAVKRAQEGYTYAQERGFDVAEKLAQNEAPGWSADFGPGSGMMAEVVGMFADMHSEADVVSAPAQSGASAEEGPAPSAAEGPVNSEPAPSAAEEPVNSEPAPNEPETEGTDTAGGAKEKVICPSCGKTVVRGKFCMECGYRFATVCPACGRKTPDGAKFCMECGTKLS